MASPTPHLAKLHGATFWDSAPAVLQLLETDLRLGFFSLIRENNIQPLQAFPFLS